MSPFTAEKEEGRGTSLEVEGNYWSEKDMTSKKGSDHLFTLSLRGRRQCKGASRKSERK